MAGGGLIFYWGDSASLSMLFLLPTIWFFSLLSFKGEAAGGSVFLLGSVAFFFFFTSSLLFFFLSFEGAMFPMLFLISGWGYQYERFRATSYFLFYAFFCSFPLFFFLVFWLGSGGGGILEPNTTLLSTSFIIFLPFLAKLPFFFLHLWLPKAHVEAPTGGSMVLAALLLKMGGYGVIRMLALFPSSPTPLLMVGGGGVLISTIVCFLQSDIKAFIAYSSVAHMNFMVVGLFFLLKSAKSASLLVMLAHGFFSAGLFYLAGSLFYVFLSRSLYFLGKSLPFFFGSGVFCLLLFGNFGVPPFLSSFSEILLFSFFCWSGKWLAGLVILYSVLICYGSVFLLIAFSHGKESGLPSSIESVVVCLGSGGLALYPLNILSLNLL